MHKSRLPKPAEQPCKYCGESYLIEKRNQKLHQAEWCLEQAAADRIKRNNDKRPSKGSIPLASEIRIINDPLKYVGWLTRRDTNVLRRRCPDDLRQQLALSLLEMGICPMSESVVVDVYHVSRQVKKSVYKMLFDYGFTPPQITDKYRVTECILNDAVIGQLHNWAATWKCA